MTLKSRKKGTPKGRQVNDTARQQVIESVGEAPLSRDLLIEYLHRLNDHYGFLSAAHLAALAERMHLAQAEVFEVATFYHHFRVVAEDAPPPPKLVVRVCNSLVCQMAGADALLQTLQDTLEGVAEVVSAPCMGGCDKAPAVAVGRHQIAPADPATVSQALSDGKTEARALPGPFAMPYGHWRRCRDGRYSREQVITRIEAAGLRGLGGAGFPTARKWQFFAQADKPRYLVINADEGEPGTFKDRYCLENDPHRVLEGALIAAWVIEAEHIYVYLRDEYGDLHRTLEAELQRLAQSGLADGITWHLRRGAGAYICGEETALLESLEGKRGLPRQKPPFPAQFGLFGCPTLINNVETLYWLPAILDAAPEDFASQGRNGAKGLRLYSVSGRVRQPGVKVAPAGSTVRQLIHDHSGGMALGHQLQAFLPGGASGGILPAAMADVPLDFGALEPYGCFVGSAAVMVLSQVDDPGDAARNLMAFFAAESCGQCTPCRLGCQQSERLLAAPHWDRALLRELAQAMADASICGLGQAAPNCFLSLLNHFDESRT